tara:strand:+ start:17397 stop:17606 length:210 start_codon:yes stop_codon:yes gene_type:complete
VDNTNSAGSYDAGVFDVVDTDGAGPYDAGAFGATNTDNPSPCDDEFGTKGRPPWLSEIMAIIETEDNKT